MIRDVLLVAALAVTMLSVAAAMADPALQHWPGLLAAVNLVAAPIPLLDGAWGITVLNVGLGGLAAWSWWSASVRPARKHRKERA